MLPFFLVYTAILLLAITEYYKRTYRAKREIGFIGFFIIFLFIGLRAKEVGTDTATYVSFFHDTDFWYNNAPTDIMFEYIGRFLHLFNNTTEYFIIASSAIICLGIFYIIYKLSYNINLSLLLFCLVGTSSIFLFTYMGAIRQCCALTFFFISMYLFFQSEKPRFKLSLFFYIIAILTHGSILFTLPFIFIIWKYNITKKLWIILILTTYIFAALGIVNVGDLLDSAFSVIGSFTTKDYSNYADINFGMIEQRGLFNMNLLPFSLWGIFLCYVSREERLNVWFVKFFFMSILLNNIFSNNLMWSRLILPFSLFAIIAIPFLTLKLRRKMIVNFYIVFFTYYIYKTFSQLTAMPSPFATGNIVVPYETWLFK